MKKTKIVCTIGPACEDIKTLKKMIQNGMNVARLNFSHGTHESHATIIERVRALSLELNIPVAIMQDLQGPKVRVGALTKPLAFVAGQELVIGRDFTIDFNIYDSVKVGERILIEDGLIELTIIKKSLGVNGSSNLIFCKASTAGLISSHKGVNIPDSNLLFPSITDKDIDDLNFGLAHDIDAVAVSFVRSKEDILTVKKIISEKSSDKKGENKKNGTDEPLIIAKIEKREGIEHFDDILSVADGIMVARGDLGVEMPEEEITIFQKMIVEKCRLSGKPVIVATEMMDSMIRRARPTRAEVSDVSNAVIDSADCVMLSGETANGKYPSETVKEMATIVEAIETSAFAEELSEKLTEAEFGKESLGTFSRDLEDAAKKEGVKAIAGIVTSFSQATAVSQSRPHLPLALFTNNKKLWNKLAMVWGVEEFYIEEIGEIKAGQLSEKTKTATSMKTVLVSAGLIDVADKIFTLNLETK